MVICFSASLLSAPTGASLAVPHSQIELIFLCGCLPHLRFVRIHPKSTGIGLVCLQMGEILNPPVLYVVRLHRLNDGVGSSQEKECGKCGRGEQAERLQSIRVEVYKVVCYFLRCSILFHIVYVFGRS